MVAVRDQRLVGGETVLDLALVGGVRERPEAVAVAVLGGRGEERGALDRALDDGGGAGRVAVAPVGQQERFEVRGRRAHQSRPVLDHMRHDVLVGEDHTFRGLGEVEGADDAALQHVAVALLVYVEGGFGIGGEDALGEPAVQGGGRQFVAGPGLHGLRQDQADDVVRVRVLQVQQTVRPYDHVVRGRGHGGEAADLFGDVADTPERDQIQAVGARLCRATCSVHPRIVRVSVP